MADHIGFEVRFWGVRGSFPTPAASHLGYGGNTSCVEIAAMDGTRLIVDAGTGLRNLGLTIGSSGAKPDVIRFLMTHFHLDHVHGLPFFAPLYDPRQRIAFYSGGPAAAVKSALEGMMVHPYYPLNLAELPGRREYIQLGPEGERFGAIRVGAFALNHPQGAWGYRLECGAATIVLGFDYEHGSDESARTLIENCRGANLLIYDAQYTPDEYDRRREWGHSTWVEAVRVAQEAGVERLVLFHHDPSHDDAEIDRILALARARFPNVEAASEAITLAVSG